MALAESGPRVHSRPTHRTFAPDADVSRALLSPPVPRTPTFTLLPLTHLHLNTVVTVFLLMQVLDESDRLLSDPYAHTWLDLLLNPRESTYGSSLKIFFFDYTRKCFLILVLYIVFFRFSICDTPEELPQV